MEALRAMEALGQALGIDVTGLIVGVDIWACVPQPRPPVELLQLPRPLVGRP